MSDIVERLRHNSRVTSYRPTIDPMILEAADEIERLRKLIDGAAETGEIYERRLSECEAENDRLRSLLREALEWPVPISWASDVRTALGKEER